MIRKRSAAASDPPASTVRWPAWIVSLALHALLFVILGLATRPAPPHRLPGDDERTVQIAIAHVSRRPAEDLNEEDAASSDAAVAAVPQSDAAASPDGAAAWQQALPDVEPPSRVAPELALPLPGDAPRDPLTELSAPRTSGATGGRLPRQVDYSQWVQQEAARLRALQPSGPTAAVQLFGGTTAEGRSFVFLLDRSKSMGSGGLNALAAAERELSSSLLALNSSHRFAVLAYHHEVAYMGEPRMLPATAERKRRLADFFQGLAAFGQTHHEYGLDAALAMRPDVVYLFSDAGEPPPTEIALQRLIRQATRQRTTLHMVRFGYGPLPDDGDFMRRLAEGTGGGFTYVNMSGAP